MKLYAVMDNANGKVWCVIRATCEDLALAIVRGRKSRGFNSWMEVLGR